MNEVDVLYVFELLQAVGTVVIAVVSFSWSIFSRRAQSTELRRRLIREASDGVDVDFATAFFVDRLFMANGAVHVLNESDFEVIMSTTVLFPSNPWQRACRSRLERFLETLRPAANVLGDGLSDFALVSLTDPVASRLRLALKAMCAYWSPQGRLSSPCTPDNRKFIRAAYAEGDSAEWG
ncbi:hypothetical protein KFE25_009199 [Diacronema lutheri]|uniref:Uncharacterized protein n=1 Tax=Diacronema lutheri TaxID=2081491 RepID=A0A8J5XMB2_DIALT|nr:hypothetical protein KFE25_009199 [Diacronema lutheri]